MHQFVVFHLMSILALGFVSEGIDDSGVVEARFSGD